MNLNVDNNDVFLKQLQKKKKKARSFNHAIAKDSMKEDSNEQRFELLEHDSGELAKDNGLELIDTVIVKKKSNISSLNQRYRDFESSSLTTVSDYDSQKVTKSAKRKFNFSQNKEQVKKPKVIDLEANKKMKAETLATDSSGGDTDKMSQQAKPTPDLYFGLFETVKFFSNEDNTYNLLKPVLNDELEIVTTEVPTKTLKTLFENLDVSNILERKD